MPRRSEARKTTGVFALCTWTERPGSRFHGLLDWIMQILGVPFLQSKEGKGEYGYYIEGSDGEYKQLGRPISDQH